MNRRTLLAALASMPFVGHLFSKPSECSSSMPSRPLWGGEVRDTKAGTTVIYKELRLENVHTIQIKQDVDGRFVKIHIECKTKVTQDAADAMIALRRNSDPEHFTMLVGNYVLFDGIVDSCNLMHYPFSETMQLNVSLMQKCEG